MGVPGRAEVLLLRQPGVVPLHEGAAVFSGMLDGFSRQQTSRGLATQTIQMRRWRVERFQRFADSYCPLSPELTANEMRDPVIPGE